MENMKISEHDIQRQIIDYLRLKGHWFWRNNTMGRLDKTGKHWIPTYKENIGSPDIFVIYKNDCYGIEVKSSTGKQSPEQKQWEEGFTDNGGIYLLVRDIKDLQDYL
jgi:hypothetical protein